MPYGTSNFLVLLSTSIPRVSATLTDNDDIVRLGKSGLKVSRIILGCMSYGSPEQQAWVLNEEEGFKHIKAA